jgi:hypothetical protein
MNSTTRFRIVFAAIGLLTAADCLAAGDGPRPAALPKVFLETSVASTPVTGKRIEVAAGGDFQAALNQAQPGDEIVLQAGATYAGNFILPAKKGGEKWITVRTSNMAGLPKEGTRVSPKDAAAMPKIVVPNGNGAISTALKAGYYRLIGLEVTVAPTVKRVWALVNLGKGGDEQKSLDVVAHHLILDRMYIHGGPKHDCFRCVALNSAASAVIDSYLSEGHVVGFDAQAICGVNGPGPFKIVNNYLEGSGENVMFGGADPAIRDLVPSDIEFRYNHCFKPLSWKIGHPSYAGIPWAVKNLFELKNARRVLIEGNLFENNWVHAQNGTGILFTVRNQSGTAPWSAVQDVTMINNRLHNSPTAFVVMGYDSPNQSQQTQRFLIRNNLFEQVERSGFMITWGSDDIEIDHNTFVPTNYLPFIMSGLKGHDAAGKVAGIPCRRFRLTNNIFGFGQYGPGVDGGQNTFAEAFPDALFEKNLLVGHGEGRAEHAGKNKNFLAGFLFEPKHVGSSPQDDADWAAVGFANFAGGDYRLTAASKYRALGTDGKALGADIAAMEAAVAQ